MFCLVFLLILLCTLLAAAIISSLAAFLHRPQDIPGAQGKQGPAGFPGITGINGDDGPSGMTGFIVTNNIGQTGYLGVSGITGPDGNTGLAGPIGPTGPPTGPTGLPGVFGPTPPNSFTGPTGPTGLPGPIGMTGLSSSGPIFIAEHYTFNTPVVSTNNFYLISDPPMTLVNVYPTGSPPPADFDLSVTGTISFTQPSTYYLVSIGMDIVIDGLPSNWAPSTIVLGGFPMPTTMLPIVLWPSLITPTSASASLGISYTYQTPPSSPTPFTPNINLSLNAIEADTALRILLLDITIQRASPV